MPVSDKNKPKILSQNLFPVVGIGASAGGLDAFKKLLKAIPEDSGLAYILVQHLHPAHESALPEILQGVTKVPVEQISDNVKVKPDHIYVIPSNKMLVATDGVLQLSARPPSGRQNLPIDIFFKSLAEVHQAQAIGVVLSGNGADGTEGLKDIKAKGGLTFAQEPASASNDSMPRHAIDAAVVDFILIPEKMPEKLMELKQSLAGYSPGEHPLKDKTDENAFKEIIALLRLHAGADFTFYKQTTIRRRIIRRMVILKLENVPGYLDHLKKNEPEQEILFHELLIPVTSFFRDPLTFGILCEKIFPQIFKNKPAENSLRAWIAGCSTGQEAYSIAMCICEYLSDHISKIKVQVFATDISGKSIKTARTGCYTKKELEGVSAERLHKFFDKTGNGYQVKKFLREMCVFAVHNFLKDPPYAKLDFVSCRNVLIYLEPFLQQKTLTIFHYSLNEKGILLLGKSETAGGAADLFIPLEKKEKFYTRISSPGKFTLLNGDPKINSNGKNYALQKKEPITVDFQRSADDILLAKYTPAGVIVNEQFDIVQFRGSTSEYLAPAPGKASLNVLKMAKEGLAFEIRNALHKAQSTGEPFTKETISINNGAKLVTIEVIPLLNTVDLYFLILFKEQAPSGDQQKPRRKNGIPSIIKLDLKSIRIKQLEKELAGAREDMYSITEDQGCANEELQSSNEELLSGSEELQSLNEELETTKEELQSSNEALMSINEELNNSNEELDKSRRFAEATLAILHEPMLVLDGTFCIKSANKSFYTIFRLTENETLGKVIFQLQDNGWNITRLREEFAKIKKAKEKLINIELDFIFPVIGERILCVNIQPIQTESGEQLIILAFNDITSRKNEEKLLNEKTRGALKENLLLHNFFMQTPALLHILKGPEHIFELANPVYREFIGNRDPVGKKLIDALPELEGQIFVEILDKVYDTGEPYIGKEMPVSLEMENGKLEKHFVDVSYQAVKDAQGHTERILAFAYDVTEQVKTRRQMELNAEMIHNLYMKAPAFICTMRGPKHIYTLVNPSYQKIFGKREITGKPIMEALPELEGQGFDKILDNVYKTGEIFVGNEVPIFLARDEGLLPEQCYFNFSYQPIYDENKKINGILVFGYEVTDVVQGKKLQEESNQRFRILADAMPQKIRTTDPAGKAIYFNQQWFEYTHKSFEGLTGGGWKKIIHPDDWDLYQQTWQHSIDTSEDFEQEIRFLKYDGTYCWHLSRGHAQKDKNSKIMLWIETHTDIDEQKLVSEKIRIAEEFNRNVLESSPECVKVLDEEGRIIFMNSNGLCQMGIDDFGTIKNKYWWELWGKENKPVIESAITKAFKGDTAQFQAVRSTFKGLPKWWDVLVSPVTSANSKVTQVIAVSRDITEHKNLENAIAESEERFREMANAMPQKVWTTDEHNNLNYFNRQWLDYTMLSFKELKDGGWKKIIHPDDWQIHQLTWQHSVDTGDDYELEERLLCYNGTYHWHLSRGQAQKDANGKIIKWTGTNTDIDEQKIFAQELKSQIDERIKLEKQKNHFISMASHELKTPITSLKGYIQILEHRSKSENNSEAVLFLERMDKLVSKLNYLINDLLESSKLKGSELAFNENLFDFNELVKEVADQIQQTTRSHTINIDLDASDMIFGDRDRVGQVISNMLSNAIKYSPKATKINVTTLHKNDSVHFYVQDFGIGISEENQQHVFEQFYRVSGSLEDTFPGLGLGMFISAEIIRKTKGTISVKSEPGYGSTFCFTLPLKKKSKKLVKVR